jgi:hypothetical protein
MGKKGGTGARVRAISCVAAGAVAILIGVILFTWNLRWGINVLRGPAPVSLADLANVNAPSDLSNQWVSFTCDNAVETGVGIDIIRRGIKSPQSRFVLVQVNDQWLVVEVPHDHASKKIVGYVENRAAHGKASDMIQAKFPDHKLMPIRINGQYAQRGQYFSMVGIVVFLFLGGVFFIYLGVFVMPKVR